MYIITNERTSKLISQLILESFNEQVIGYRSETTWGFQTIGERDLRKILFHEMYEMNNVDILDYCLDNYRFGMYKDEHISDIIADILTEEYELNEKFDEDEAAEFIDCMINSISEQTGINCKYGLWLCNSKEDLIKSYEVDPDNIQAYDATDGVILSDLDEEGVLYAFEKMPEPLEE